MSHLLFRAKKLVQKLEGVRLLLKFRHNHGTIYKIKISTKNISNQSRFGFLIITG